MKVYLRQQKVIQYNWRTGSAQGNGSNERKEIMTKGSNRFDYLRCYNRENSHVEEKEAFSFNSPRMWIHETSVLLILKLWSEAIGDIDSLELLRFVLSWIVKRISFFSTIISTILRTSTGLVAREDKIPAQSRGEICLVLVWRLTSLFRTDVMVCHSIRKHLSLKHVIIRTGQYVR